MITNKQKNTNLLEKFINKRRLAPSTARTYISAVKDYESFNKMSIEELIEEADMEEEQNIRMKRRRIKDRLEDYLIFNLNLKKLSNSSSVKYHNLILTIYRHFEIEVPYLQKPNVKKDYHKTYEDIPKAQHIRKALDECKSLDEQSILLFMSSSGTAKNETLHLTVKDFFNATREYHDNNMIIGDMLDGLSNIDRESIVPLFTLIRIKKDYLYYTCCSPDASNLLISSLTNRYNNNRLKLDDKLFDITNRQFEYMFKRINNLYKWGKVGFSDFFHSHALRHYHGTMIGDKSLVDALQGRKRDHITETYIKHDPFKIKEEYLKVMHKVIV